MADKEITTRYVAGLEVTVPDTDTTVFIYRVDEVDDGGQMVRVAGPEMVLGPITVEQARHLSTQLANALTFVGFPDDAFLASNVTMIEKTEDER